MKEFPINGKVVIYGVASQSVSHLVNFLALSKECSTPIEPRHHYVAWNNISFWGLVGEGSKPAVKWDDIRHHLVDSDIYTIAPSYLEVEFRQAFPERGYLYLPHITNEKLDILKKCDLAAILGLKGRGLDYNDDEHLLVWEEGFIWTTNTPINVKKQTEPNLIIDYINFKLGKHGKHDKNGGSVNSRSDNESISSRRRGERHEVQIGGCSEGLRAINRQRKRRSIQIGKGVPNEGEGLRVGRRVARLVRL